MFSTVSLNYFAVIDLLMWSGFTQDIDAMLEGDFGCLLNGRESSYNDQDLNSHNAESISSIQMDQVIESGPGIEYENIESHTVMSVAADQDMSIGESLLVESVQVESLIKDGQRIASRGRTRRGPNNSTSRS